MQKEIIISVSPAETRIAITEDGVLSEFFIDQNVDKKSVGDIILGKIKKVLPGIKAAFIDIDEDQDAFLHFSDVGDKLGEYNALFDDSEDIDDSDDGDNQSGNGNEPPVQTNNQMPDLKKGKEIIVQIIKEPIGNKGFRVTSRVSLPGRFLVLLPFDNKIGVSKRIFDLKIRRKLRSIVKNNLPKGFGAIIRTVAEKEDEKTITDDLKVLLKSWQDILQKVKEVEPPAIIHEALGTTTSIIRDLFNHDVTKIFVDNKRLYKKIKNYLEITHPQLEPRLELFKSKQPIFEVFKIDKQIDSAYSRRVPLPSGGSIVFDTTEAMTVVDVNSGKYAASMNQEMNSLRTDLEASREIARQARLRDVGGIIVIDFIDLADERNRKKVFDELKKEFRKDKAKYTILPMTEFGLVQITRQRIRKSVFHLVREVCPYCAGTGQLVSKDHIFQSIERWVKRYRLGKFFPKLTLKVNPIIYNEFVKGFIPRILKLQIKMRTIIRLKKDNALKYDEFKFFSFIKDQEVELE